MEALCLLDLNVSQNTPGRGFDPPPARLAQGCPLARPGLLRGFPEIGCDTNCPLSALKMAQFEPLLTPWPRLRREARKEGNYYVPGDPKLAFVMRIRGINQVRRRQGNCINLLL